MNTPRLQQITKRAKIYFLQWRIDYVLWRLEKCPEGTLKSGRHALKLITLVQTRNNLYTPADVAQIEKERGLV